MINRYVEVIEFVCTLESLNKIAILDAFEDFMKDAVTALKHNLENNLEDVFEKKSHAGSMTQCLLFYFCKLLLQTIDSFRSSR